MTEPKHLSTPPPHIHTHPPGCHCYWHRNGNKSEIERTEDPAWYGSEQHAAWLKSRERYRELHPNRTKAASEFKAQQ